MDHILISGPPGLGKYNPRPYYCQRARGWLSRDLRPSHHQGRRPGRAAHQFAGAGSAVHRRDSSAESDGRGAALSRTRGSATRSDDRRGPGRPVGADRPATLYPGRGNHPHRPGESPAARPFRHSAQDAILQPRRTAVDRRARRTAARHVAVLGCGIGDRKAVARHPTSSPAGCLRRIRDFAEVAGVRNLEQLHADQALTRLEVDGHGLDAQDRRYLSCISDIYEGGPVGVETLAAYMAEARDVLEDVIEPYLMQQGLLMRTPRGRTAGAARLGLSRTQTQVCQNLARGSAAAARPGVRRWSIATRTGSPMPIPTPAESSITAATSRSPSGRGSRCSATQACWRWSSAVAAITTASRVPPPIVQQSPSPSPSRFPAAAGGAPLHDRLSAAGAARRAHHRAVASHRLGRRQFHSRAAAAGRGRTTGGNDGENSPASTNSFAPEEFRACCANDYQPRPKSGAGVDAANHLGDDQTGAGDDAAARGWDWAGLVARAPCPAAPRWPAALVGGGVWRRLLLCR